MAINTIKATMQMRRGAEVNFDPDQMTAGEWAISTDSKKVWMCFAPGIVRRMATYEAFEQDMEEIRKILATCQDIQEAVEAFEALAEKHKNDAANSAQSAAGSASAAEISETNAAGSATSASGSAQSAAGSAKDAKDSEDAAKVSEDNAAASAAEAEKSEEAAAGSAQAAAGSATDASTSAGEAAVSAGEAEDYSLMAKSHAIGTDGQVRPNDATDNSKYYSDLAQYLTDEAAKLLEQAQKLISAATAGALIPSGTVAFENLPADPHVGYMYNISNAFVTDDRFAEGPGIQYNPGANVYWTADGQWDVMIGVQVTGVKGAAESFYRQGNVNLTPTDIGLGNVSNVTTNDQTPTFTQAAARENIASGESNSTLWGKVKKWFADLKTVAFSGSYNDLSDKPTIPTIPSALKNPYALTFTGAVTGSYDGSAAKSVAIPTALKNPNALTVKANGTSLGTYDGSSAKEFDITASGIGAVKNGGEVGNNVATFNTGDTTDANATSWTNVAQVTSGLKLANIFTRISTMMKNTRYLYKLIGTTDISAIGEGTLTGAINALNTHINTGMNNIGFWEDITTNCNFGYIAGSSGHVYKNLKLRMVVFDFIASSVNNQSPILTIGTLPADCLPRIIGIGVSETPGVSINFRFNGATAISTHSKNVNVINPYYLGICLF